jgi:hypothetical protein
MAAAISSIGLKDKLGGKRCKAKAGGEGYEAGQNRFPVQGANRSASHLGEKAAYRRNRDAIIMVHWDSHFRLHLQILERLNEPVSII